jgi:hypothetical protein
MPRLRSTGRISMLRVHDLGTKYGPANDQIDVEVVVKLDSRPNDAYGFTLRDDPAGPSHQGMLDLLRDAFNLGWSTTLVYDIGAGKRHGILVRAWVTRPVTPQFDVAVMDDDVAELVGPEPLTPD